MSELTLTVLQLGFVVLLWVFVLSVVGVLRRDLFGTRRREGTPRRQPAGSPRPAPPASPTASPAPANPAPVSPTRAARTLDVVQGAMRGTSVPLGSAPVLIGRAPECTLVLDDDYASGRHARIFPRDGRWFVEDLGSTNGTELGRSRVTQPVPIETGQPLTIGRSVLELRG